MLHFFVNTGVRDTLYYWNELSKAVNLYCELRKICPDLDSLNISDPNEIECFMQILSTVYDIIEGLIAELNPSIQDISELKIRKAAELLNILEANDAIMRYRG